MFRGKSWDGPFFLRVFLDSPIFSVVRFSILVLMLMRQVLNVNEDADDVDKMEITPVSSPTNTTTTTAVANNHTPQHSADYNDNHNRDTNNMSSGETPLFCKFCTAPFENHSNTIRIRFDEFVLY